VSKQIIKYISFVLCAAFLAVAAIVLVDKGYITFVSRDTPAREEFDYETDEKILEDLLNEGDVSAIEQNEYDKYVASLPEMWGEPASEYIAGETVVSVDKSYTAFEDIPNTKMPAPAEEYNIPSGYTCTGASDGVLTLNRGGKYGYYLVTGYWLTDPEFTEAYAFNGNVAVVKTGGRYGVIDSEGNLIIPAVFDSITDMDGTGMTAYKRGNGYTRIVFSLK